MKKLPSRNTVDNENFTIKFGGEHHKLDALTLVYSVLGFSTVIQELNMSLNPENEVDIKIKATQPGSFEVVCELLEYAKDVIPLLSTMITDNQEYLKLLLTLFGEFVDLKKLLGKEKPGKIIDEAGGKVTIETNQGNITVHNHVYNFYSNQNAQNAVSKAFRSLEQDEDVQSFGVYDSSEKELLEVNKEDFSILAEPMVDVEPENIQEVSRIVMLRVLKVVFDKNRMWEFVYNNNKISARIEDELFIKKITNREVKFAQGDLLKVRLKIKQVYNDEAKEFLNDGYIISEVLELVETPPNIQQSLVS